MANILTAVKEGIQLYWDKAYSRSTFNDMFSEIPSIQTCDFSTF